MHTAAQRYTATVCTVHCCTTLHSHSLHSDAPTHCCNARTHTAALTCCYNSHTEKSHFTYLCTCKRTPGLSAREIAQRKRTARVHAASAHSAGTSVTAPPAKRLKTEQKEEEGTAGEGAEDVSDEWPFEKITAALREDLLAEEWEVIMQSHRQQCTWCSSAVTSSIISAAVQLPTV